MRLSAIELDAFNSIDHDSIQFQLLLIQLSLACALPNVDVKVNRAVL